MVTVHIILLVVALVLVLLAALEVTVSSRVNLGWLGVGLWMLAGLMGAVK